jgi:oxygen-independent coproporphyrinogen-3 oxidase
MQYRDMDKYIAAIEQQQFPVGMAFKSAGDITTPSIVKAAFDKGVLVRRTLPLHFDQLIPLFEEWQRRGLASLSGEYLSLTLAGQFWSVTMAQILIKVIAQLDAQHLEAGVA